MNDNELLKERIKELETEIFEREKDLSVYRRELTQANKRLETLISDINGQLKLVHAIQKQLVPTEIPHIQGFEFSSKFVPSFIKGGDYYDIFEHEDRSRFGIIVASSSGHVMSALLLSVLLKMTSQMEARRGDPPEKIMEKIIAELLPNIMEEQSADLFYGNFDRRKFILNYCRVGDIIALHFDSSSQELKTMKPSSSALVQGFDSSKMQPQELSLNPHDKMIFCTRGITEAKNMDGEEFGLDRLFKAIHEYSSREVHDIRNQILYQVQKFTSGQEPPRDMTVVVVQVKDQVIKLAKR